MSTKKTRKKFENVMNTAAVAALTERATASTGVSDDDDEPSSSSDSTIADSNLLGYR